MKFDILKFVELLDEQNDIIMLELLYSHIDKKYDLRKSMILRKIQELKVDQLTVDYSIT